MSSNTQKEFDPTNDFRFGIEIEVLIRDEFLIRDEEADDEPNEETDEQIDEQTDEEAPEEIEISFADWYDWNATAEVLKKKLEENSVETEIMGGTEKWRLRRAQEIFKHETGYCCDMELNSKIYRFRDDKIWNEDLDRVWDVLKSLSTHTTDTCATQIHVSPVSHDWVIGEVKKMAKAIVYYERCVDSLLPYKRRTNHYCRSNRHDLAFKSKSMRDIFLTIDGIPSTTLQDAKERIYDLMNSGAGNEFRWNFQQLDRSGIGTIEFRQPPGSLSKRESHLWISFTRAYVHAAMLDGNNLDPQKPVEHLDVFKTFLLKGASAADMNSDDQNALTALFEEKTLLPDAQFSLTWNQSDEEYKKELDEQMVKLAEEKGLTRNEVKELYATYW